MAYRPDAVATDSKGAPVLIVEAKRRAEATREWAAAFRRNLIAHGALDTPAYFLLVFPRRLFLWEPDQADALDDPPRFEIDATTLLAPYFEEAGVAPDTVSGYGFELIVAAWLYDVLRQAGQDEPRAHWLIESGLGNRLRGARLSLEPAL